MLSAGAKQDEHSPDEGATPLSIAASNGFLDILKFLLECGADKDSRLCLQSVNMFQYVLIILYDFAIILNGMV